MKYTTTVTSKGTITISAYIRKALHIEAGQKLSMSLTKDNKVIIDPGTNMADFKDLRSNIVKKIPKNLRGLSTDELKKLTEKAKIDEDR